MLPYINKPFEPISNAVGPSVDELKVIFIFFVSYPLAGLLKRIPDRSPHLKNLFIIGVSLFYLVGLFDLWAGIRTLFISSAAAYAISAYIRGPWMPWIGFMFLMGHMSVNHIYRHIAAAPSTVDITGPQMVLVMKLTAFCWNVHDGRLRDEDLSDFQKEHMVKEMPGFLDYAAWVLFFPSLMAGPAFDYIEYQRWINLSMFEMPPGTDPRKVPKTRYKRKIPRSGTPATIKATIGLVWLITYVVTSGIYDPKYLLSPEYMQHNILRRIWIMHMVGMTVRTKYYAVWTLAEGACILSGMGFKGLNAQTGKVDWDRLQNVNPLGIELAQNSRAYLGNWNINTNNWLRSYMYLRVTPKGKKPGFRASMATFVTSAFWHGFEPGYYMSFVFASLIQGVAKDCRRYIRPLFLKPSPPASKTPPPPTGQKVYYDVASWLATQMIFSFTVMPFILLTLPSSLLAWTRVYLYAIVCVVGAMGFFASPGKAWLKKQQAARLKKAGFTPAPGPVPADATGKLAPGARPPLGSRGTTLDDLNEGPPDMVDRRAGVRGPTLGMPDDPGRDLDEIMDELKSEIERRRERGQTIGDGLQEAAASIGAELKKRKVAAPESLDTKSD